MEKENTQELEEYRAFVGGSTGMNEQNQSIVARLRAQIEQEHAASVWALTGLSSGNAQHAFITRRMGHLDIAYQGLAQVIGEEQAIEVLCEVFDGKHEEVQH